MNGTPGGSVVGFRFFGRLQGFLDRLRAEGVAVGVAAGVDLGRALRTLPILDRASVLEGCRATLAKSPGDLERIDRVFDAYWTAHGPPPVPPPSDAGPRPRDRRPRRRIGGVPPGTSPSESEGRTRVEGRYSPDAPGTGHALAPVPAPELRRARAGARRFRRSVATLPGRRWQSSPDGAIDLRRTARSAARTAGEWVRLGRRSRAPRRADLVVLWDVSGSMREHTGTLCALVHSLARSVLRTRVYAFGNEIEEVTSMFRGLSYERSIPGLADRLAAAGGGTRIARCLGEFRRHWGATVRATTTVLVLSDGWDLDASLDLARELERLKARARRVVWLSPYAADPGFRPETAALKAALPHVDLLVGPADFPRSHGPARVRVVPAAFS